MARLGRYEILDEIGRGAMGRVYRARDPDIDRIVALKVMMPEGGLESEAAQDWRRRFQREARAAGRLAHPNIVTIFDVGEDQGRPFLVMEFVAGRTLEAVLKGEGRLPLARVVGIAEQVAAALDHAHQQGIVHRDIKPANILLTSAGTVKVADFGIARIARDATQTGGVWGSPSYMSPEQVSGRPLDGRSDLFSLATVLYELLSGEKPFAGDSITTVAYRIAHEEPTPLHRLNPALPPAMDAWLAKAMAKEPGRRHQRATELARDLRAAAEGGPAGPSAAATTKRLTQPVPLPSRPRRAPWLGIGMGCLALIAVGVFLVARPKAPVVEPPPAATAPAAPAAVAPPAAREAAPPPAAQQAQQAEAELAAERRRLEAERARLAREQAAMEAERRRMQQAQEKAPPLAPAESKESVEATGEPTGPSRVRFVGNTLVPTRDLERLAKDVGDGRLTAETVRSLLHRINEHYASQGYVLARAVPHRLGPGKGVQIEVLEGRIGALRASGLSAEEERAVLDAFKPVVAQGVVQKQAIGDAVKRLAERHGIVPRLRFESGAGRRTVDLVVERSPSGRVEVQMDRDGPRRPAPLPRDRR